MRGPRQAGRPQARAGIAVLPGGAGCAFCLIVAGRAPARIVHRWPDALALHPLDPVAPGHLLVIPLRHVRDVTCDPQVSAAVMCRAAEIARPPCNVITSAGEPASQTQFHLHLHVLPRLPADGLLLPWSTPGAQQEGLRPF